MDKRIDERFRKPRRAKGTPFYIERNYWAVGIILLGGLSWFLLELTPGVKRLKKYQKEHLNKEFESYELKRKHMLLATTNPLIDELLNKARERAAYKDEPKPQGWFAKFMSGGGPDV